NQRHAEFVKVVIPSSQKSGSGLAFGTAVNLDDDGPLAREILWRAIIETGDFSIVETLPANKFWFCKLFGNQAAKFAVRPASQLVGGNIERKDIRGGSGRRDRESEVAIVAMPVQASENSDGQLWNRS